MATADEVMVAPTPMGSDLGAGVKVLALDQEITFTAYVRVVLPLDGFVFLVRNDLLSESSVMNAFGLNGVALNQNASIATPARTLTVKGSLHYATQQQEQERVTYAINRVIFTSLAEVQDLNLVDDDIIYIGEFDGIRFAFSSRDTFYRQANLYHYVGHAIYSWMGSQIIDDPQQLNVNQLVVSNSLPAWLALNQYDPPWHVQIPLPKVPLFPSFLLPANIEPPFAAVHIAKTEPLQMMPIRDRNSSSYLLTADSVTVTFYGCNNQVIMDWRDAVLQYTVDTEAFGMMDTPIVYDDKEIQNELNAIAMRKHIDWRVTYYQGQIRNLAIQAIKSCVPTWLPTGAPPGLPPVPPIGVQLYPLATTGVVLAGDPVVAAYGSLEGGFITNPATAQDQGIAVAEVLFVNLVEPAELEETTTTVPIQPGGKFTLPSGFTGNVSVNAATNGHQFGGVVLQSPTAYPL